MRLELGFFEFPLINLSASCRISDVEEARWRRRLIPDPNNWPPGHILGLFLKKGEANLLFMDIYSQAAEEFKNSQISIGELHNCLIPPRALAADWLPLPLSSADVSSSSAESSVNQTLEFVVDEARAVGANQLEQSNRSKVKRKARDDLPTYEQLKTAYNPSRQHLDIFMKRTFNFPGLEQLILKNCREYNIGSLFLVRLLRHLTRFREANAPDSPTRIRLVDLRGIKFDKDISSTEFQLLPLLAPHVQFLIDSVQPS